MTFYDRQICRDDVKVFSYFVDIWQVFAVRTQNVIFEENSDLVNHATVTMNFF